MNCKINNLPNIVTLEEFNGNSELYLEKIYQIFHNDFIKYKTKFRGVDIRLKWHPMDSDKKAYTFYHMTHEGKDEKNRTPDLRRCERIIWAKPTIENCDNWGLKVFSQKRKGNDRICIWLEFENEPDYIIILHITKNYLVLWTSFVMEYEHEKRKKQKEYEDWKKKNT